MEHISVPDPVYLNSRIQQKCVLITLINWFYIYRAVFLATWREIPDSSERQYLIENVLGHTADAVADKMRAQGLILIHSFLFLNSEP